jgi:hypothetical protein
MAIVSGPAEAAELRTAPPPIARASGMAASARRSAAARFMVKARE